jgi:hypothetical protein
MYATLINTAIAQCGTILFFFLMLGYYCYKKNRPYLTGLFWGIIIAIKLFPALLFFYMMRQRRIKILIVMSVTVVILWLIPYELYGISIYKNYLHMLSLVRWYGDSWNASIYGFLFRTLINTNDTDTTIQSVRILYGIISLCMLYGYLKILYRIETTHDNHHQQFCLTIVMMLLLSPLGWMYYFPILSLPLLYSWSRVTENTHQVGLVILWTLGFFCINFPIDYVRVKHMASLWSRLTLYSLDCYGLFIVSYFIARQDNNAQKTPTPRNPSEAATKALFLPIVSIIGYGVFMMWFCLLRRI